MMSCKLVASPMNSEKSVIPNRNNACHFVSEFCPRLYGRKGFWGLPFVLLPSGRSFTRGSIVLCALFRKPLSGDATAVKEHF
jgi:hypothetical protein